MRSSRGVTISIVRVGVAAAAILLAAGFTGPALAADMPLVAVDPFELPSGGEGSDPRGVTDSGMVIGVAGLNGRSHVVYWNPVIDGTTAYEFNVVDEGNVNDVSGNGLIAGRRDGLGATLWRIEETGQTTVTDLGSLGDWQGSDARAVNNLGLVAGTVYDSGWPVLWVPDETGSYSVEYLPRLTDSAGTGYEIWGMNNAGWIVGAADLAQPVPAPYHSQVGVVWRPTAAGYAIELLPGPENLWGGNAYDINDQGTIVGESYLNGDPPIDVLATWRLDGHGAWQATNLGGSSTDPSDIDNKGQVAGTYAAPNEPNHPAVWVPTADGYDRIATLLGTDWTVARAMNDSGLIAGIDVQNETGVQTAVVWSLWSLSGFMAPVDTGGVVNRAVAGSTIPLRWTVSNPTGVGFADLTTVEITLTAIECEPGTRVDPIEEYAPRSSGLMNLGNGNYQLNWKTSRDLAGTCGLVRLSAPSIGPASLEALFRFK